MRKDPLQNENELLRLMYYDTIQNQMCDIKKNKTKENNSTDVSGPQ